MCGLEETDLVLIMAFDLDLSKNQRLINHAEGMSKNRICSNPEEPQTNIMPESTLRQSDRLKYRGLSDGINVSDRL